MELSYLEQLENRYKFQYPELYKQLCRDGMLGCENMEWDEDTFVRIQENPPFLYYSNQDVIEKTEFAESIASVNQEETIYYIPFLVDANELNYVCFYLNAKQEDNHSIVSVFLGDSGHRFLAENLQDYIFRNQLESSSLYMSTEEEMQEYVANQKAMLRSHKPYLREEQFQILEELFSRDFQELDSDNDLYITLKGDFQNKIFYIVSESEVEQILREMQFPLYD